MKTYKRLIAVAVLLAAIAAAGGPAYYALRNKVLAKCGVVSPDDQVSLRWLWALPAHARIMLGIWLANPGGEVFMPAGTYSISSEILIDLSVTNKPILLAGAGAATILQATGASNAVLHVKGVAGTTRVAFTAYNFAVQSATSGTSSAGIHLDGISDWSLVNIWVNGLNKMTNCFQLTAAQQGQISGGRAASCVNGALLEASGAIHSNGVDWHGMTFWNNTGTGITISANGSDDLMFHANHLTGIAGCTALADLSPSGIGSISITDDHFEPMPAGCAANMIVRTGKAFIKGSSFYGSGITDLEIGASTGNVKVVSNLIDAAVTIDAGATDTVLAYNAIGGNVTDGGTRTIACDNHNFAGTGLQACAHYDQVFIIPSLMSVAGNMLTLTPPAVSGSWGMEIDGSGVGTDIYTRYGSTGPTVGALTTGVSTGLLVKSAPGGTTWATFTGSSLTLPTNFTFALTGQMSLGTALSVVENGAPAGVAGSDIFYPDSTAHRWKMNNNNGGAQTVAALSEVPQLYNISGTIQASPHMVRGTCTLGTDCAVTLSGAAVFTSNTSYDCFPRDATTPANAVTVALVSGSAVTFTGTGTDVINYFCVGN